MTQVPLKTFPEIDFETRKQYTFKPYRIFKFHEDLQHVPVCFQTKHILMKVNRPIILTDNRVFMWDSILSIIIVIICITEIRQNEEKALVEFRQ